MIFTRVISIAITAFTCVSASPCPYGQLAESGQLDPQEAAKFYAARDEGEHAVSQMMHDHQKREFTRQEHFYNEQVKRGELTHGGGLLNGLLQPLTGKLSLIELPTLEPQGLAIVPDAEHPYIAPKTTAVRGMCPTLNTMANHGYISRDGITTFAEAANACQITLGFGYDTCTFLSALGLIAGGDLLTGIYSIGGMDARVPNSLGPAYGISKHGVFEVDQSISRVDYALGNQANFNLKRWNRLVGITKKHNNMFGVDTWAEERQVTYQESRDTNPHFTAEAKWLAVTLAERVFIFRALPNGTHEGLADMRNVAPFYLNETFPEPNWFRRAEGYTLENTGTDIVALFAMSPDTLPGKNFGLNNFVPIGLDFEKLTPSEATCFLFDSILDLTPGQFSPELVGAFDLYAAFINGAVKPFFGKFNCDYKSFVKPGKNAGSKVAGVSTTCNTLVDGKYQC